MLRPSAGAGLFAVTSLLWSWSASADGISAVIDEDYAHSSSVAADTPRTAFDGFRQRYRLTLDDALTPTLRLNMGGTFDRSLNWQSEPQAENSVSQATSLYGLLFYTSPLLAGTTGYTRLERRNAAGGTLISEEWAAQLAWRPEGLPVVSLRLSVPWLHDSSLRQEDHLSRLLSLTLNQTPVRWLGYRYSLDYVASSDRIAQADVTSVTQRGAIDVSSTFLQGRGSVSAGLNVSNQLETTAATGAGATVATQIFALSGLLLVESLPATPELDTLEPAPALVDSNTTASAAVNLGPSQVLAGDDRLRDLGLRFTDALTQVNTLYVWVDRQLPDAVASAFTWTVWQSDDNLHWTQVPLEAPVTFGVFQSRFELTIHATGARYLKVATRPLGPAVTTDRNLADIFVTELQAYFVAHVVGQSGWTSTTTHQLSGGAHLALGGGFSLDSGLTVSGLSAPNAANVERWSATAGVQFKRQLTRTLLGTAQILRQDQDQGRGHEGGFTYGAGLTLVPLATLSHSLVYSGQYLSGGSGQQQTDSLSLLNSAGLYRGVGTTLALSISSQRSSAGTENRTGSITWTASLQPHRAVTVTCGYGRFEFWTSAAGTEDTHRLESRLDASATFNPLATLYVSGTVTRSISPGATYTLGSMAAGFSPFPRGSLQLNIAYNQTLDQTGASTRQLTPSLRWTIRRGTTLTVSYIALDGGTTDLHSRTFAANLRILL